MVGVTVVKHIVFEEFFNLRHEGRSGRDNNILSTQWFNQVFLHCNRSVIMETPQNRNLRLIWFIGWFIHFRNSPQRIPKTASIPFNYYYWGFVTSEKLFNTHLKIILFVLHKLKSDSRISTCVWIGENGFDDWVVGDAGVHESHLWMILERWWPRK